MATTVDTLLVRIEADMADLKRDLSRVAKTTEATGKRMSSAFRSVGRAVAAIGGTAIFGAFIKSAIDTGAQVEGLRVQMNALLGTAEEGGKAFDQMSKFASRVPFSLRDIQSGAGSLAAASSNADELGELLQITGNIAAQFDIPFNEAAANVQRALSAGIGAADLFRDKGVTAFAGFEAGVSYSSSETAKKLIENFGTGGAADGAMDAFAKTTSGALSMFGDAMFQTQAAMAESGLNEGFRNLVNALTDVMKSSDGFAQAVGGAMGSAFDFLANAVRAAQAVFSPFVDTLRAVGNLAMLVASAFGELFKPAFNAALALINERMGLFKNLMAAIVGSFAIYKALGIVRYLVDVGRAAYRAATAFKALALAQRLLNSITRKGLGLYITMGVAFLGAVGGVEAFTDRIAELGKQLNEALPENFRESLSDINSEIGELSEALGLASSYFTGGSPLKMDVFLDTPKTIADVMAARKEIQNALSEGTSNATSDELVKTINSNVSPVHGLREEYVLLKGAMDAVGDQAGPKLREAFRNVSQELEKTTFKMKLDANPAFAALVDGAQALGDGVVNSFRGMLDGTTNVMDGFKDMLKNTVADVIAQIFRLTVVNQMLNAIFPGLGLQTSTLGGIFGRASGGTIQGGQPYLVGERGPELIVPNTGGVVMNNQNTRSALGGGGSTVVHQTINVNAGVSQTVRAEMMSLLPRFKQDTMNAVVDAKRRGGSFGQAFG